jgi:hypothetical protein
MSQTFHENQVNKRNLGTNDPFITKTTKKHLQDKKLSIGKS